MIRNTHGSARYQQGNILFMSIALLAALSILGLSSMRTALIEEKISHSIQDLHIATEAAESALRHGQRQLKTAYQKTFQEGFTKTHKIGAAAPDLGDWVNNVYQVDSSFMSLSADDGFSSKALDESGEVADWLPKYRLEEFFVPGNELDIGTSTSAQEKEPRSTSYFRVIAYGVGLDGKNEIMLESVVIEQTR